MRDVVIGGHSARFGSHVGAHIHGGFVGSGLTIGRPLITMYHHYPFIGSGPAVLTSHAYPPFFNPYFPYGYSYPLQWGY